MVDSALSHLERLAELAERNPPAAFDVLLSPAHPPLTLRVLSPPGPLFYHQRPIGSEQVFVQLIGGGLLAIPISLTSSSALLKDSIAARTGIPPDQFRLSVQEEWPPPRRAVVSHRGGHIQPCNPTQCTCASWVAVSPPIWLLFLAP